MGREQCAVVVSLLKMGEGVVARHSTIKRWADLVARTCEHGQRAESSGLIVVFEAAVWLKLGLSPSRAEEVVDELL